MNQQQRTEWVRERARAAGFDLCGIAPVEAYRELEQLPEWLARGYGGEMAYLWDPRRTHPAQVLKGAQSLIVTAINYNTPPPYSTKTTTKSGEARGWISRYAWGDDYHEVIKHKLDGLVTEMRDRFSGSFEARSYVDTGPIHERVAAKYAGLGWLGKNTCLINQGLGSWLFLGVIITTLALDPTIVSEAAAAPDLCGSCTRCLDACPTQAFPEPYVLDARHCISYLTIEMRGVIPEELRPKIGTAVVGCDICQDVCPWNRKAPVSQLAPFQPRSVPSPTTNGNPLDATQSLCAPHLGWLVSLSQNEFSKIFRKSAAKRAKWRGLIRNVCVALGNSALTAGSPLYVRVVKLLGELATSPDPIVSEHAQWALTQIVGQ